MYPPFDPILFQIGPLAIRWYGILMMLGVASAAYLAAAYVARRGENPDNLWDMLIWVIIPGFIGARLWYVFIQSPRGPGGFERYLSDPASILRVWEGGLHIFGGFLAGLAALLIYVRVRKLPALIYLDGIALGLPLGQAIARWANFINQELYGPPTTLPWGLRIDPQHRIGPYADLASYPATTLFHPLFLYESLWNLVGFGLIFWAVRRYAGRLRNGDVLLMYLFWYPLGRFFIEFLRTDSWFFAGTPFNAVHLVSAAAVITSAVIFVRRDRSAARVETTAPAEVPAPVEVRESTELSDPSDDSELRVQKSEG
ncbi:MAG: prolipoprotein diacylglyceryl transferase [Oscillochloris sp.]|nr:prolipoprotein diacylglyceryl transferase [Oscillochloris sp.]